MRMRSLTLALAAVVIAALVVVAMPTGHASANGGGVHCVRYGETLYGIARAYGTSASAIAHANGIWNPNYVRAGQCLRIPSGYGYGDYGTGYGHGYWNKPGYVDYGKPGYGHGGYNKPGYGHGNYGKPGYGYGRVHCVKYGETLTGIAWMYGTSAWSIANANGINHPNWIRAGQCLTIPGW
jgi:LysM repeat protein